jgi:phosphoribosylformylglycinamidine (FGAM) synthase-like amidotransferase family enzyme
MGLMPHPEHAVDPLTGSTDGAFVLGSLVDTARTGITRTAVAI